MIGYFETRMEPSAFIKLESRSRIIASAFDSRITPAIFTITGEYEQPITTLTVSIW